jgi:hypothetical protein
LSHRLTSRPTPGRLVIRYYPLPWRVTSHRAWRYGGQIVTHCGKRYPPRGNRFRIFVRSVDLVPVTCRNCLSRI